MKIIDCFIFYNELNLLEYRLNFLGPNVDYFILVESNKTFVGNDKPFYFSDNSERFNAFKEKIIHVVIEEIPDVNPWKNEERQRNGIDIGIKKLELVDEDLIFISDVDEIPDFKNILPKIESGDQAYCLEQDMYYYNLQCKMKGKWGWAKVITFGQYKKNPYPHSIRNTGYKSIPLGGWHFSYFGDVKFIRNKIMNFSHTEYSKGHFIEEQFIQRCIVGKRDLFGQSNFISIEQNDYLPDNFIYGQSLCSIEGPALDDERKIFIEAGSKKNSFHWSKIWC
jgi:beta-1,4-mannosyl-glycoprotein beta-1,4-N-acetylglucosaminyltransferase